MAPVVVTATVCHLTVTVYRNGDADISRASGRRVWTGAQRFTNSGDYRLAAGNHGHGPAPEGRVPLPMVEALERALDVAHDERFGRTGS